MKIILLPVLCLALSAFATADLSKLDGTWKPVSGEIGGSPLPTQMLSKMVLKLKAGAYDYDEGHGHDVGKLKEVGSLPPLGMDIIGTKGPNKGRTYRAIYEYDGKTLIISYSIRGGARPTSFATKGKGVLMMKYRRAG